MKSKKDKFIELTGENPEDIFGPDWENYIDEWFWEIMTINQAMEILDFIVECKMKRMLNDEIVWELANKFNVNSEPGPRNQGEHIKQHLKEKYNDPQI